MSIPEVELHLRSLDRGRAQEMVRPLLDVAFGTWHNAAGTAHTPSEWLGLLAGAVQQEAATLPEMVVLSAFAFGDHVTQSSPECRQVLAGPAASEVIGYCIRTLDDDALATPGAAKEHFHVLRHHFRDTRGLRGTQVMLPLRAALTGTLVGPCLGVVASLLGLQRCRQRLKEALR